MVPIWAIARQIQTCVSCALLLALVGCSLPLPFRESNEPKTYITVRELLGRPELMGKQVYLMGALVEASTLVNREQGLFQFDLVHVSSDATRQEISDAIADPRAVRIKVRLRATYLPDAIKIQPRVIVVDRLQENGIFDADQILTAGQ